MTRSSSARLITWLGCVGCCVATSGCNRFSNCELPRDFDYRRAHITIIEGVSRTADVEPEQVIERGEYRFYRDTALASFAVSPDSEQGKALVELRRLFETRSARFNPPAMKACVFHPDYEIVWSSGGDVLEMQICYGCDDLQARFNQQRIPSCEMERSTMADIERVLAPFGKHHDDSK